MVTSCGLRTAQRAFSFMSDESDTGGRPRVEACTLHIILRPPSHLKCNAKGEWVHTDCIAASFERVVKVAGWNGVRMSHPKSKPP
jgi:hypothetical protein